MASPTLDRWLLVNYAGYPYAPNSLMPDNGLANLAGALLGAGCEVEIFDYGTVSTLRRLTSPDLRCRLDPAWRTVHAPGRDPWTALRKLAMLARLHRYERTRANLQARIVAEISDEIVARVRELGVQAVGFKLWNGDGLDGSATIAQAVRRACPDVRIFGGGPQVDMFMDLLPVAYPVFDALVYGEGESTILRLAESGGDSAARAAIPNLLYLDGGAVRKTALHRIENLDDLPMPAYAPAVYPAMRGDEKVKIIVVDESRGCRNACAFCIHPVKSDRQVRVKSVARLMRELDLFQAQAGIHTFRFAGSCTPYALLNGFAAEILRTGRRVNYASFAHVRDSNEADFAQLRQSGCQALFFGIESGSQRVLDKMCKGVTVEDAAGTLRRVREAGIFSVASLIVPAPGETAETEAETLALMDRARPDSVTLQAPIVTPRTPWFEKPARFEIVFPDREAYRRVALHWKVRLLLPPALWTDLPIRIGGRSFRQVLRETQAFGRRLAALGIPSGISDETLLMSRCAAMEPAAFCDAAVTAFFTGDGATVSNLVARINANA